MRRYLGEAVRYALLVMTLLPAIFLGRNFGCGQVGLEYRYGRPYLPKGTRVVFDRRCEISRLKRYDVLIFRASDLRPGAPGNEFFRLVAKPGEWVRIVKEPQGYRVYVDNKMLTETEMGVKPVAPVETFVVPLDHVFVLHEYDSRSRRKLQEFILPIRLILGKVIYKL